jgi:hypothetical protein
MPPDEAEMESAHYCSIREAQAPAHYICHYIPKAHNVHASSNLA